MAAEGARDAATQTALRRCLYSPLASMLTRIAKAVERRLRRFAGGAPQPPAVSPDLKLARAIRAKNLTYLSESKLVCLATICRDLETQRVPGIFIEAGCALGGSAVQIASAKSHVRPFLIYDVFGMIPPPGSNDPADVHARYETIATGKSDGIGGDRYYGYESDLYRIVQANLQSFGIDPSAQSITLIKGLLQDTLDITQPVAFAHIDVDWYDPVLTCLTRIFPHLVPGGSIVLDDYDDWGGCRKATDEFLAGVAGQFALDDAPGSLTIRKLP